MSTLGAYYYKARFYSTTLGRFLSADPLTVDGYNRYQYVRGNPLRYTDPTGLCGEEMNILWDSCTLEKANYVSGDLTPVLAGCGASCKAAANAQQAIVDGMRAGAAYEELRTGLTALAQAGQGVDFYKDLLGGASATDEDVYQFSRISLDVTGVSDLQHVFDPDATWSARGLAVGLFVMPGPTPPRAVRGYTKHGLDQAISRDGVGVSTRAIRDTVKHGDVVYDPVRRTYKYVSDEASVVLNRGSEVVTTWARKSTAWRIR